MDSACAGKAPLHENIKMLVYNITHETRGNIFGMLPEKLSLSLSLCPVNAFCTAGNLVQFFLNATPEAGVTLSQVTEPPLPGWVNRLQ